MSGTTFTISPKYLGLILKINRPILWFPPIYDDLCPKIEFLKMNLGEDLKVSSTGSSVSIITFSLELKILTLFMFSNLYPFTNTAYLNHGRAIFLCDLMNDVEIDICHHIFHILVKTATRTSSRNCLPFCSLVIKILKLKGVPLSEDESLLPKPQPIDTRTYNASKGHSSLAQKASKQESGAPLSSSSSCQMDVLVDQIKELNTKISGLTSIMYTQHSQIFTKLISLETQMDQIQQKLEDEDEEDDE